MKHSTPMKDLTPIKPSESKLLKATNESLVSLLFENAVMAEREFWRQDVLKHIMNFEPGTEKLYQNSGTNILKALVNVIVKSKSDKNE